MLEAVARSAADQQHVLQLRVEVDQEVAVRAVLILADFALRSAERPAEGREAAVAKSDDLGERGFASGGGPACRDRPRTPCCVVRELDPAALEIGKAVENVAAVEVGPAGHVPRAGSGDRRRAARRRRPPAASAGSLGPMTSGKSLGSHGPSANTKRSAAIFCPTESCTRRQAPWCVHRAPAPRLSDSCRRRGRSGRPASAPSAAPSARRTAARTGRSRMPSKSIIGKRAGHLGPSQHVGRKAELPDARRCCPATYGSSRREEEQDAALVQDRKSRDRRSAPSIAAG